MGYRNYLGQIEKAVYDKSKMEDWEYRDKHIEEFHELGKYVDSEIVDNLIYIEKLGNSDGEHSIIDIESIPIIVNFYATKHLKFLKDLLSGSTTNHNSAESYLKEQIENWESPQFIYDIGKDNKSIVFSWEYQYLVFELLHIYKTFDTEKYYLTWTGH